MILLGMFLGLRCNENKFGRFEEASRDAVNGTVPVDAALQKIMGGDNERLRRALPIQIANWRAD